MMKWRAVAVMCSVMWCVMMLPWHGHAGYTRQDHNATIKVASDLEVLSAQFGAFIYDNTRQEVVFTALDRVDMVPGKTYGWQLVLRTTRQEIAWREILTLPTAPHHWGVSEHVSLSLDRTSATTSMTTSVAADGTLSNYWIFSEGDPKGAYSMRIEIDGVQVAQGRVMVD